MSAKVATASTYLSSIAALESYLERVSLALKPKKELSTHNLAFHMCNVLLEKLVKQKSLSDIMSNDLLKVSQLLDPRSSRNHNEEVALSSLSMNYSRLFGHDLEPAADIDEGTAINVDEIKDLSSILSASIYDKPTSVIESIRDENSIECKIKVFFNLIICKFFYFRLNGYFSRRSRNCLNHLTSFNGGSKRRTLIRI